MSKFDDLANIVAATPETIEQWYDAIKQEFGEMLTDDWMLAWATLLPSLDIPISSIDYVYRELAKGEYLIPYWEQIPPPKVIAMNTQHRNIIDLMQGSLEQFREILYIIDEDGLYTSWKKSDKPLNE